MQSVQKRLDEAYNNVAFFADDAWVENSNEYCKANQILWTRECKTRDIFRKEEPSVVVNPSHPVRQEFVSDNRPFPNYTRELSSVFHRLDSACTEPWMFPEVESVFNYLVYPSSVCLNKRSSNLLSGVQDSPVSATNENFHGFMYRTLEKCPGLQRFYTVAEPVTETEIQLYVKKKTLNKNFAEMALQIKLSSDKIKRIWEASSRIRKINSFPMKGLFTKFHVPEGRKCSNKRNANEELVKPDRFNDRNLWVLENHKERALDFSNMQKLASSLNAMQSWITALTMPPPPKEPPKMCECILEPLKPVSANRRSYSAVLQGLEPNATSSPKSSLDSIFEKSETPQSPKTYDSSSDSEVVNAPEYSPVLPPRLLTYSPRKRFVPYEQRNSLLPSMGTRWGTMQMWSSSLNYIIPTLQQDCCHSSSTSVELEKVPVTESNVILRELYALQQAEVTNPPIGSKRTASQPNIPHVPHFQQQQPVPQKIQQPPPQMNAHSFHYQHIPTAIYPQFPVYPNVTWLPLTRNALYPLQQNMHSQNSYYRPNQFHHSYQIPSVMAQQQALPWNYHQGGNKHSYGKQTEAKIMDNPNFRLQTNKRKPAASFVAPNVVNRRILTRDSNLLGEAPSFSDLERQALEQYSASHESLFGQLEKQGVEQYDEDSDGSSGNSENCCSPPMPADLFGGRCNSLMALQSDVWIPVIFAFWYRYAMNAKTLLLVPFCASSS